MFDDLIGFLRRSWVNKYFFGFFLVVIFAFFDNVGRKMFLAVENNGEVYQVMEPLYMNLFHGFVVLTVFSSAAMFYYIDRDLRDLLGYLVFTFAVVYSGLWDILYYVFQGVSVPSEFVHLIDTPAGWTAQVLGASTVTRELLFLNIAVFLVAGLAAAGLARFGDF